MAELISTEKEHSSDAETEPAIHERPTGFYAMYSHPVTQVRLSLVPLMYFGIEHGIGDDARSGLFHVSRQVIFSPNRIMIF